MALVAKAEVAKNSVAACNQCHQDNAKKDDWVFSQYYPARHGGPEIEVMK